MNLADYFTKHHPQAHHQNVRGDFLMCAAELQRLRQEIATKNNSVAAISKSLSASQAIKTSKASKASKVW